MTEIAGLVGIYGAIDQVVQTDPELRAAVSRLLPLYRDPELHWYDDFRAWLDPKRAEAAGALFPSVPEALRELAEIEPHCRMRPRRLFAIAAAMRAFPEMREPDNELGALTVGALRVSQLAESDDQARSLQGLLADEPSVDDTGPQDLSVWWDKLVATAYSQSLIPSTTGMRPRPCSGRLVKVPGVRGPVAALKTEFETDEIDFDQATRFIEPVNWKKCMPNFWCDMKRLGVGLVPGVYRYHEVVSSDCGHRARAAFTAETDLDFNFMWLPDVANPQIALTNYQLSEERPLAGDLIRVDEGSLLVAKVGPGARPLRITTTKRIQFSYPFSSQALAMIMCALGYADVAGDLLCCAASISGDAKNKKAGTKFPGEPPAAAAQGGRRGDARRKKAGPTSASIPSDAAAAIRDCIEECGAAARDWPRKIAERPNTANQLVQDMASIWARVLREGATAAELGARATRPGPAGGPATDRRADQWDPT